MKKSIMLQGTASSVGKSIITTALCRIFTQDGYNVSPFKSQNMSLNSYITYEGHEIGRAQAMQAEASRKAPSFRMNPILIKPTSDCRSQIIVEGVVKENMEATEYYKYKSKLKEMIKSNFDELLKESDIVVIEGAGSPAEINLKKDDIVNMGVAKMTKSPVVLIGDIDRGGVFASIYGTIMLLEEEERKLIKGIIINKFRGSLELLKPGIKMLEDLVNIPVIGVIPYFTHNLEDEDSATDWDKYNGNPEGDLEVVVIKLPRISNFTDFNTFKLHRDVKFRFVNLNEDIGNPDLIILPGSKSTIDDLILLKERGMDKQILEAHSNGSYVFGVCGGYQMLGNKVKDPLNAESSIKEVEGLSLLPVETTFRQTKTTTLSKGYDNVFNCNIKGYEIHMGKTELVEQNYLPLIKIDMRNGLNYYEVDDGAVNKDRTVFGTYFHGIFDNTEFTRNLLNKIRESRGKSRFNEEILDYSKYKEEQYDNLAKIVRENIDLKAIYAIMEEVL
ncbi:cobyric acid synthase [Serpentinicella alkaliphila]|uniref:Cobyric acid synthase n=1 Tax=Serpentinicella alkaliphila TaxID=1734049 RepID=A0A4R2U8R8_9FIRM|nr:cobyric acid synthase [Serpentinicella alkaliphila]QUH24433.1 cobyric acid synthase [Serpentinicella alkaliphila]TCQ04173.1 adenosylcobyric acid synthase (glutamine-hydrolysing) [Serpentinicella alkaliphila]